MKNISLFTFACLFISPLLSLGQSNSIAFLPGQLLYLPNDATPNDVAVADFNHDGRPDLAVAETEHDTIAVFNQSAQGFAAPASAKYFYYRPYSLAVMPLDGYTSSTPLYDDLAVIGYGYLATYVNSNTAQGSLTRTSNTELIPGRISVGTGARLVSGHFNTDPYVDLAFFSDGIPVGFGEIPGAANGLDPIGFAQYGAYGAPSSISTADMNNDGYLDRLATFPSRNVVSIFTSYGAATGWWPNGNVRPAFGGTRPVSVVGADVDRDGLTDLAVANETSLSVTVLLQENPNSATYYFKAPLTYTLPVAPREVLLADLNSDNRPDMLVLGADGIVRIFRNAGGSGQALFDATPTLLFAGADPALMRLADLDNDGDKDLIVPCRGDNTIAIFQNIGTVLATHSRTETSSMSVYPNPAKTTLNIRLPLPMRSVSVIISLLNSTGQVVQQWQSTQPTMTLSISHLPRGLYILQAANSQGYFTSKKVIIE